MVDDIIEGTFKGILKGVLRFLLQIVVEIPLFYTGEIIIFIVTLGKRKPGWNYYLDESASKFLIFTEVFTLIGFAFWLFIAWLVNSVLLG